MANVALTLSLLVLLMTGMGMAWGLDGEFGVFIAFLAPFFLFYLWLFLLSGWLAGWLVGWLVGW